MVPIFSILTFVIIRLFGIIDWSWIYVIMVPFIVSLIVCAAFDVISILKRERAVKELQRMFDEWCKEESDTESDKDDRE